MIIGNRRQVLNDPIIFGDPIAPQRPVTTVRADEIFENLGKISQKYNDSMTAKANEYADGRIKGNFESDEELLAQAKESLDDLYGSKKEKLATKTAAQKDELGEKMIGYESDRDRAKEKVDARYKTAWGNQKEDLARKGISHSSIAELSGEKMREDYRKDVRAVDLSYDKKAKAIEEKIDKLTRAYDDAMKNYEISYAIELENRLGKLKSQRDKLEDQYYKEKQTEREKAYTEYIVKESSADREYESKYGDYREEKKANMRERYDYLKEALKDKSSDEISKFLADHGAEVKHYLGLYYDQFVREVS